MGEQKRRAAFGARGASRSNSVGRGLLFPSLIKDFGGNVISTVKIPEEDLASAVLYWDKMACPTNNLIHASFPREDLLVKEGLLIRPRAVAYGTFGGDSVVALMEHAQVEQFAALEKEAPGFWCMTESDPTRYSETSAFENGRSLLVELSGSLPLPPTGTPIEEMLEFKRKRAAELERMRAALDDLYLKIASSADEHMAMQKATQELDRSISDLLKSSKEWWKLVKLSDLKTLGNLGASTITGALIGMTALPTAGAIVGGGGAVLSIANGIKSKLKADRASPYWYAVSVQREWG
jgi:hypothetical protein